MTIFPLISFTLLSVPHDSEKRYILERHKAEFAGRAISEDQIPDAVMNTVIYGEFVCYQRQKEPRREIYKVSFNEQTHYIAVDISDNGYIVGANPSSP